MLWTINSYINREDAEDVINCWGGDKAGLFHSDTKSANEKVIAFK